MNDLSVSSVSSFTTSVTFSDGFNEQVFASAAQYRTDKTPLVTSISPSKGSIYGSELVTITGTNLNIGDA